MGLGNFLSTRAGIGGLFDNSDEDMLDQLKKNQELYQNLNTPELSKYSPESYQYQTVSEDPRLKGMQMDYLGELSGLAKNGNSPVDDYNYYKAGNLANQESASNTASALQNAQARGVSGSGLEMGLREQANQSSLNRMHDTNLATAAGAAQNKALYNQAYGNAVGNVRNQDYGVASRNADIINNFNQLNTGTRNQAQQYNTGLQQQNYQNQLSRLAGMSGANTGMAQGYAAESAGNAQGRAADAKMLASIMSMFKGGAGGGGAS